MKSDSLFVYARLLNDRQPLEVIEMPTVFSIASSGIGLGLGRYARVVTRANRFCIFARSRALLQCGTGSFSIDKIDIHLENSIRYKDIPDVHVGARRLKIECHGVHDLDTLNGILK